MTLSLRHASAGYPNASLGRESLADGSTEIFHCATLCFLSYTPFTNRDYLNQHEDNGMDM